ncbi:MAG: ATP-binding cassette domain-containing protein [Helicobacter sp.]|nr:ATP-binding cassette domain-containing protein [Helicobacter sp.]
MIEIILQDVTLKRHNVHFNLHIKSNEKIQIIGQSGAGKSTLLWLIAGFLRPDSGKILLKDCDVTNMPPNKRDISILFQDNNVFLHLSVLQNLALGLEPNLKITTKKLNEIEHIAQKMGINKLLHKKPDEISGGQKQRVALARALLQNKSILLLDEPFSALDSALRLELLELVKEISINKTLLIVSHDEAKLDKTIQIYEGRVKN